MGYFWKVSFISKQIPVKFYGEIVSYLLLELPECLEFLDAKKETGSIELIDFEVEGTFDFAKRFKKSIRDKIWSLGFVKFNLRIELSEVENSELFDLDEYTEYLRSKAFFSVQKPEKKILCAYEFNI